MAKFQYAPMCGARLHQCVVVPVLCTGELHASTGSVVHAANRDLFRLKYMPIELDSGHGHQSGFDQDSANDQCLGANDVPTNTGQETRTSLLSESTMHSPKLNRLDDSLANEKMICLSIFVRALTVRHMQKASGRIVTSSIKERASEVSHEDS